MPWAVAVGRSARSSHHTRTVPTTLRRPATSSVAFAHSTLPCGRSEEPDRQLRRERHRLDATRGAEDEIPQRRVGQAELGGTRDERSGSEFLVGDVAASDGEIGADRVAGVVRTGEELLDHLVDSGGGRQWGRGARVVGRGGRHGNNATWPFAGRLVSFAADAQAWHRCGHDRQCRNDVLRTARTGDRGGRLTRRAPRRGDAPPARRRQLDRGRRRRGAPPLRPPTAVEEAAVGRVGGRSHPPAPARRVRRARRRVAPRSAGDVSRPDRTRNSISPTGPCSTSTAS